MITNALRKAAQNLGLLVVKRRLSALFPCLIALLIVMLPSPASADDARWKYPQQYSVSPKGVNLQTGRFLYSKTDISIGDLSLIRTWGDSPSYTSTNHAFGPLTVMSATPTMGFQPSNTGWTHNFAQGVYYCPGCGTTPQVSVVAGGKVYTFAMSSNQTDVFLPTGQSSAGTSLAIINGQWSFIDRSGNEYTFVSHASMVQPAPIGNRMQLLQTVAFADGSRQDYSYTSTGQPRFIKSNRGYAIGLEYSGGNVVAACSFNLAQAYADDTTPCTSSARRVTYSYNASGFLASVTDLSNNVVTVTYATTSGGVGLPTCISLANSSTCEIQNVYGQQPGDVLEVYGDQVRIQTTATGQVWNYDYVPTPDPQDQPTDGQSPIFTRSRANNGLTYIYVRYDRGRAIEESAGGPVTKYRYVTYLTGGGSGQSLLHFDDALPGLVIRPEGNMEFFGHDARGNMTIHSYWPKGSANVSSTGSSILDACCMSSGVPNFPSGSVTFYQFFLPDAGYLTQAGTTRVVGCGSGMQDSKLCDKPTAILDGNGNQTDYTYDPAHGGVLTETGPAVNGIRPQTRYTYAQRYAWVAASGGGYSQVASPIWVLTQKSTCRTGAASGAGCALGTSDEIRTLYDYGPSSGPSNLLLRGTVEDAIGASLRTCFAYDQWGNKIATTLPRAGLTSCP